MRIVLILLIVSLFLKSSFAGEGEDEKKSVTFIQPEFQIGKALPGNSSFPETQLQTIYSVSIGKMISDPEKKWAVFLKYPSTGLSVSYTNYGHDEILGSSLTVMPYFSLNTIRRQFNSFHFKIGLGATYFSKFYDANTNPRNLAIGSSLTWAFQTTAYYNFLISKHVDLNLGFGFIHHSNGHTQMPNLGLNSLLFSFSSRIYLEPVEANNKNKFVTPELERTKQYFVNARLGMGMHEFGGPDSETGGVKRVVNVLSVGVGTIYKQVVKLRLGATYRFYHQYYNYIINYQPDELKDHPAYYASNLLVYVGGELLLGHIGIDAELGINLMKPFYSYHQELYGDDEGFKKWLKSTISTRLGLKFYLNNTANNPKNNLYIGGHINANLSQADFSEFSIGYVRRFNLRGE